MGCLLDCRLGMCGEKGRHLRHGQNRRHFLIIALSWGYHLTELHDNESNCSLPETFSKIVQCALSEKIPGSHLLRYFVWKKVLKNQCFINNSMFISIYILHLQIFVQKSHCELKHILQKSF